MNPTGLDEQISLHVAALESAPGDEGAFQALESLYREHDRWEELVALYEGRARRGADSPSGLFVRAAELAHRCMKNSARAEDLYRQALHADPRQASALSSMVEIYQERGDYESLAEALERLAGRTADPREAALAYLELGRVQEVSLLRRDRAALFYARATRLAPDLVEARDAALRCQIALRRFAQAKRTLDEAREQGAERAPLAEQYARLGSLLVDEPLDHGLAMDVLSEALALDPAAPGAAAALERLKAIPRTWRADAKALDKKAGRAKERHTAAQHYLRAAGLHAAYDPDGAAKALELVERALLLAPAAAQGLDLLERAMAEREDWRGLSDGFRRLSGQMRDRVALAALCLRLARIDLVHFADPDLALESLERALALEPANETAAQQALELHLDAGRRAEALSVLERHLAAAPPRPQHASLRLISAEIAVALGDEGRALAHLEAARRLDARSPRVAAALAPLLERAGEWRALSEALETQAVAELDPERRALILEALARVEADRLGAPRDAVRHLAQALRIAPSRTSLRAALDETATRAGLMPELALACRQAAASPAADGETRKALLVRAAEAWDSVASEPERAIEAWREVVALDPDDARAYAALDACRVRAGLLEEVAHDLRRRADEASGARRRELLEQLAQCHVQAGDHEAAAGAWREAIDAGGETELTLRGLTAALAALGPSRAEERLEALRSLAGRLAGSERAAVDLDRASLLVDPLQRLDAAVDLLVAVLSTNGILEQQLERVISMLEALRPREVDPLRIAQALAPVYAARDEPAKQAAVLELIAEKLPLDADPRGRARLLLDASAMREERLADPRGALSTAAAALRACPAHGEARATCERLAGAVQALPELYALLDETAGRLAADPDEEREVRRRAAEIAEADLGDADGAAAQLRRCLELTPDDPETLAALTRVALGAEEWQEACELLARRAGVACGAERVALLAQLAEARHVRLCDPAGAAHAYREALESAAPEARPRLLARLAAALESAGDPAGQAVALEELARTSPDPAEAADAARRRARLLWERLGEPLAAVACFRAELEKRPDDGEVYAAIESLAADEAPEVARAAAGALLAHAEASGDPRRAVAALEILAARAIDAPARAWAERLIARAFGERLGQWSLAFAALQRAARAAPGDPELRRELREAAAQAGAEGDAAHVYEAEILPALGSAAAAAWRELGALCEERLGDTDRATRAYGEAWRLEPDDLQALSALRRLHRAAGRDPELADVTLAFASRAPTEAEGLDAWREAARVLDARLGDAAGAAAAWGRVAERIPDDLEADAALERLLTELDRPADLAVLLARRRPRLSGQAEKEDTLRLAELKRSRLDAPGEALELLAAVLRQDPAHEAARGALLQLAETPGPVGREALALADPILRTLGEHAARSLARERRLRAVAEPFERARLHAEIRRIFERDVGDPALALAAAVRAFAEGGDARDEAGPEMERLAEAAGAFDRLASAYDAAAAAESGEAALELRRRAARVRETRLEDAAAAIAAWTRVCEAAPDDEEALAALERLHAATRDTASLAEVGRRRAALCQGEERAARLVRLAEALESLDDEPAALAAAQDALAEDPRSIPALSLLARIHGLAGRTADLCRVLLAQADLAQGDLPRRLDLLAERARVLEREEDGRSALEAWAEVQAESSGEPRALEGLSRLVARPATRDAAGRILEDVYRAQGDARNLVALLEARAQDADAAELGPLLAEIASLHERLGDRAEAFRARARALRETVPAGDDAPALRAELERLAAAESMYSELAEVYEGAIARGLPAPALGELRRRLASLYADRLERPDLAARALEAVAAEEPEDVEVLAALARLYRGMGAWRELCSALHRQVALTVAPEAKKDLLLEVATIMQEDLSDREGAMDAYRQILSVDPEDPNALRLLAGLLGGAERWEELVGVLGREVEVAEKRPNMTAEAAELRFRLGRIRHQRLADVAGAVDCYREVLGKAPRHPSTLAALEELAQSGGAGAYEAATLLEPIYEQEGEYGKLVGALETRASVAADASARAALLRQAAEVQAGPMRNPDMAFLTAARSLRDDPDAAESIALCVRLAESAGLHEELGALLAEVVDRPHDPGARTEIRRRIARLAVRSGDPRRAAEAWSRVLEIAPDDAEALEGLTEGHRGAGDPDALAQVLRRRAALEEIPGARGALLWELAPGQEEKQKDPLAAASTLRRLLEIEPGRRDALARLDRLCVETGRWVELADVLAREVASVAAEGDLAAASALRQRLAELKETRLLDREGALALYEEILAQRPDDTAALARLEAAMQRDPGNARAATALGRAYAASGAWPRYAAVLEVRAGGRPDPVERKALFMELADVQEHKLANPELAFVALCRAFRDDPADPALRADLERLAAATGHLDELCAVYEDEFGKLSQAPAAEVALTLGAVHEKKGAPRDAIGWFEKARRLDPAAAPRALGALDRLYRASSQHAELGDVLEAEASLATGAERVALLMRLGVICEEALSDPGRAARAYEALVEEDPRQAPALRALERIYEAKGSLELLASNLSMQRDLASDPPTKLRLTARMAATAQALGGAEAAVELWRETLGLDPRHERALSSLEELFESLERWQDLADLLRGRLALTADRREGARLHDKLGEILASRLDDPAAAVRAYQAVLDADPRNKKALEALRDLYAKQGDLDGLASIYRRLVPLQEDAAGVKAIRMKLAEVLLQAGKKGEAVEQGRRAFELEPHAEPELARLAAIFEGAGAPQDRVKAIEARAVLLGQAGRLEEAIEAWTAAADGWEKPLGKLDATAAALEKVLEIRPSHRDAWTRLRDLYSRSGRWRDFVRVSDVFTPHLGDRAERVAVLKEVADAHERRLGQKEMAFIISCRTFAEDPTDAVVAASVQRLAGETEAWDELAAVYEQVAEDAKGLQKARLLIELGRIRDRRADDADGAEAAFRRALEVDPASPEALDALTDLFTRRGRVRDLVIVLEQKLEAAAGLEEKKATLREMARLYDTQLKDPDEAIAALKRVLELDGADAAALELLAGLYRRQASWGDLAGILARARDLTTEDDRRIAYQLQIAALHEGELADDESAVEAYRAVLGLDDRNSEALAGLERLYTKLDRFAELNRVYEKEAEIATDPRERVRILGKSASIWEEKLGNHHQAIERNEAVLAIDGSNLPALKNLERLYRSEAHWEKLIEVLQRHASLTQDRRELVALEVQIGDVWWKELGRLDRAEEVYGHALQVDPDSREVISSLARLHERSGNWNLALEMLQREAKVASDAVEIQSRIGRIQEEMLGDRGAAKAAYARALDADPGHLPSLRALRGIADAERDRDAYLKLLVAESRYAEDEATKARLLDEAGRIHQEEKDDPDSAVRLYEEALKRVPDHLPAARPLADLYVARTDWRRAEAVLDVIVRRLAQDGEAKELCRQSYRLGYVAEKLGNKEKALACYRRAYELDATYLPALEGLGHLLVQGGGWDEALRIFQAILIHHRDGLTDLEVVETYWQIGEIQAKLGQGDRAAKSYEKALEIDSGHEPSRRALVGVREGMGDYESAVDHRQRLLGTLEGAEKVRMLLELGSICRDRLQDPYQAIDAFISASRTDPGNVEAAEALLGLYRDTRQHQKAADALARLLEQPAVRSDPPRAARLHHALATTLRDDLHDDDGAARALDAALDADPKMVQAFAELEALLTARKRWRDLEGAYVRMIQRLPKGPEAAAGRIALWKTLGELYRRVLNDVEGARMAFEVAAKADPGDVVALEAHAELAAKCRGREPEAIEAYRRLLKIGNAPQPAVSALIGLQAELKRYDEAYAAAQTLAFILGGGTTEEGQVVARLRRFARDTASGQLDDAMWTEKLLHERARGPLVAILSLLVRDASEVFIQSPKDLGLNPKKDEIDVAGSMLFFANMYKYVARTLGLTVPRLFRSAEAGSRLQLLPLQPWALLASEELFKERPKKELWFTIGKSMAFLRPELTLARLMPHDQLNAVFQAAASLGTSRYVVTADLHLVERLKRRLEKVLPEETRTQKLKLLARAYCDVQQPGDVRAYMDAAELTSNRVGAVLAGDLDVVRRMVVTERAAVSKLKEEARLRDLVLFCTSEDHAALRQHLGLSVVVPT